MTQDEVMEIAIQAHRKLVTEVYVGHMGQLNPWEIELLKIFAKLVAAKKEKDIIKTIQSLGTWATCEQIEKAIKVRGIK